MEISSRLLMGLAAVIVPAVLVDVLLAGRNVIALLVHNHTKTASLTRVREAQGAHVHRQGTENIAQHLRVR